MSLSYQTATAGLLWTVAIWRLPSATNSRKQRTLWGAFAALAVAMTFEVPALAQATDSIMRVNSLTTLVKHLFGVVASSSVLEFVIAVVRPRGFLPRNVRRSLTLSAMTALIVFFALSPRAHESKDFFEEGSSSAAPTIYMTVFLLYIGTAMTVATWLFLSASQIAPSGWLRSGLRILGAGTAVGIAYSIQRAASLVLLALGHDQTDSKNAENIFSSLLKTAAILLILLGSCLPPIPVMLRTFHNVCALRRLAPLWKGLAAGTPHVVLDAPIQRRRVSLRLHRRIIEINDASVTLREYVPAALKAEARKQATASGLSGEAMEAVAEACWLAAASRRAQLGYYPLKGLPHPTPGAVDLDLDTELRWLCQVSAAYHARPLVRSFANAHARPAPRPKHQEAA
ncbi:MAB_1171c family putative transporter [Streptomyces sp. NPDC046985]|uniref:MAB_1171c family putative transporter n=1 Tax=Streptomyces sp. NPDC046985 TaxID=3155377 RepID=UPI0034040AAE